MRAAQRHVIAFLGLHDLAGNTAQNVSWDFTTSSSQTEPTIPDDPGTDNGYCYTDTMNLSADLSNVKASFSSSNWQQTILDMYTLRWPSGQALAKAQLNDQYFAQFVEKGSFDALAGSMMVAIHEETHMYDLDPSRSTWDVNLTQFVNTEWQPRVNVYGGFPRSQIKYLIENKANKSLDDLYLEGQQGTYKFHGVLTELNAGLMGLSAAATIGDYAKGPINTMDAAAGYMLHLQQYLRTAKEKHSNFYQQISNDQELKDFITIQWLRLQYFLDIASKYPELSYEYDAIRSNLHEAKNLEAIRAFTGHQLQISNCLSEGDNFTQPY
ncbi:MAG: hypothetical protein JAY67_15540 [Candidatus Thiodiazotropha taylori]|nr:hypothetical protein [Candidatus Thiodiazotropha taylori]